jgi:hypothetical protein
VRTRPLSAECRARLLRFGIMFHWDLGSIPEWFGGVSFVLAFVIFGNDRRNRDRAQVDQVGAWLTNPSWTTGAAPEVTSELVIANKSSLPVVINEIVCVVEPDWMGVPDGPGRITHVKGTPVVSHRAPPSSIPPGEEWRHEFKWRPMNPGGAAGLGRAKASVGEMQVIDNAGRTWLVSSRGRPAQRYGKLYLMRHPIASYRRKRLSS